MTSVVVLHPGAMGAAVIAALVGHDHEVCWVSAGRSAASARRAEDAGATAMSSLKAALDGVEAVVSVVPPDQARATAEAVAAHGFEGTYVDANAIAPETALDLAQVLGRNVSLVDGGIVGPPPWTAGTTRLALSGRDAEVAAGWFQGSPLEPVVVGPDIGQASAFKVAFAAWTKGTTALALAIDAFSSGHGIDGALRHEWERRGMDVGNRIDAGGAALPKAWRFEGEMREIEAALATAQIPAGWFDAAAETYSRLARFKEHAIGEVEAETVRAAIRGAEG